MSTRTLKWVSTILPIIFFGLMLAAQSGIATEESAVPIEIVLFAVLVVGTILFSNWVFQVIDEREKEIHSRTDQLRALHEAALTLTTELDLASVLKKVVELACALVGAKYGALGVLTEDGGRIDQFITAGMDMESRRKIEKLPEGRGVLGLLIRENKSIRLADIRSDSRSVGFPKNHPEMKSFLGVPIISKGKTFGNLYLVDKQDPAHPEAQPLEFSPRDQHILEMFATQAAIAIENAKLYRQTQQLAVFEERERFGMDLHDGIIQSIYAIGLMLEDTQLSLDGNQEKAGNGIGRAILGLNEVIRDIRNYILDLRPHRFQGRDLAAGIEELVRDLRANSFLEVTFSPEGFDQAGISPEQTVEILHVVQEALANIRKHARASKVAIHCARKDQDFAILIEDDGIGFNSDREKKSAGNGLHNMRERAKNLKGEIEIFGDGGGGTRVRLQIPI